MDDALTGELAKKESVANRVLAVVTAQNSAIKNLDIEKVILLDTEKQSLMSSMSETDNSIKPFIFKNIKYSQSVLEMVNRIDLILNKLVIFEKENEKLLSAMELSASGRHIDAYKKAAKKL